MPDPAPPRDERTVLDRFQQIALGRASPTESLSADLNRLFSAHRERLYAVCLRFVRDRDRASDLTQETLLTAYRKLDQFRGDSSFATWLYGIARNLCFNAIRRRGELLVEDGVLEAADPQAGVISQLRGEEREEVLREAAAAVLSPLEQEAVYLRYVEQLPQERITELLGIEGASGGRGLLQRCRRKLERELRRRLDQLGEGSSFFRRTP